MQIHSTNYENTFIEIAEDCPVKEGTAPPIRGGKKSVANLQYEMLIDHPYQFTSDDILFAVYAIKKAISKSDLEKERQFYFSKGQPCFRASPLTKRYGWGIHSNPEGKIAMFGAGSDEYQKFVLDPKVTKVKAMRSSRS